MSTAKFENSKIMEKWNVVIKKFPFHADITLNKQYAFSVSKTSLEDNLMYLGNQEKIDLFRSDLKIWDWENSQSKTENKIDDFWIYRELQQQFSEMCSASDFCFEISIFINFVPKQKSVIMYGDKQNNSYLILREKFFEEEGFKFFTQMAHIEDGIDKKTKRKYFTTQFWISEENKIVIENNQQYFLKVLEEKLIKYFGKESIKSFKFGIDKEI